MTTRRHRDDVNHGRRAPTLVDEARASITLDGDTHSFGDGCPGGHRVPVMKRALMQRVKRHLARKAIEFHRARPGSRAAVEVGGYYSIRRNRLCEPHGKSLARIARDLGVLRPWERLV